MSAPSYPDTVNAARQRKMRHGAMEPEFPSWWRPDFTSRYARERQAQAFYVTIPFVIAAFLFRQLVGLDFYMSFAAAAPFAAIGWLGLRARLKYRRERHL